MADEDRDTSYSPTSVQVDRARMQGLGVGARDLDGQREPTDELRLEQRRFAGNVGGEEADQPMDEPQAGPPGPADEAYDARDDDEVSLTRSSGGPGAV
jgi:hypothetical protein